MTRYAVSLEDHHPGAEETAQVVKCFLCKREDLTSDAQHHVRISCGGVCICNTRCWGYTDTQIPGTHLSVRLGEMASSWSLDRKMRWNATEKDTPCQPLTSTHVCAHTHTCTK